MTKDQTEHGEQGNAPDAALDDLFQSLRDASPKPDADLTARVLADAAREQEGRQAPPTRAPSGLSAIFRAIGGWPSLAGLATAGIAGIWIGMAPPALVEQGALQILGAATDELALDLDPTIGFGDIEEGL